MARFDIRLCEAERRDLHECAERAGMSAAAVCRFGLVWAKNRLDVLAAGGAKKTGRDIEKFLGELRADPRLVPLVPDCEAALAAMELEGDTVSSAAAFYDLIGLVAAEPLPLPEKIRLLADLLEFRGRITITQLPNKATVHGAN